MARLIEEDEAFKVLSEYYKHRYYEQDKALLDALSRVPTADAVPVRRGTWSEEYDPNDDVFFQRKYRCSVCGGWNTYGFTKYCPECGAYMKGAK